MRTPWRWVKDEIAAFKKAYDVAKDLAARGADFQTSVKLGMDAAEKELSRDDH